VTVDALRMNVLPTLREPALLLAFEGWNDAGEAATNAASYVAAAIRAVPLAEIDCEEFLDFTVARPTVRMNASGVREIEWPCHRFVYGTLADERGLVIGTGIEPHLRWRAYVDLVSDLAARLGIRQVVLLGAFLADVLYSRPVNVTGFASRPEVLEELHVAPTGYEGPTGIVGVLAERFRADGLEVVSLWAGLPHYVNLSPNPRGAYALLQQLGAYLPLRLDEEPLRRSAAEFEERISALVASDPELTEYVRQLKRREFAQ
jgi:proteasome assembly chaperone (PAC2) family protein